MNESVRMILQILLNYADEDMVNDEFACLLHLDDHTLLKVAGIIDVLREGVQEHIDYRYDMANSHDCIEILSPSPSDAPGMLGILKAQLAPSNDVMQAKEAFDDDR